MNKLRKQYAKQKFRTCPFCDWQAQKPELILAETKNYYLTLNEYPYIEHHLLIAPKAHIEDLSREKPGKEKDQLTKIASQLMKKLGIKDYVVLDRNGLRSGMSLAHIHRHLIPVEGPHDMFYRFADISKMWDKVKAVKKYKELIKSTPHKNRLH
ncbi:MAG: HIT family protein [Candidatus Buchananbacteria bacterium]|nr:HIT family protein [Candidatus Buchananbacteria bacterium]